MFNLENKRYIGSKADLSDWIIELFQEKCSGATFADIFAGTAIISKKAAKKYSKIIINDFLYSNNIIYRAFLTNENQQAVTGLAERLKNLQEQAV